MRDILNGILSFIASASLSDDEFDALTIESAPITQATYDALDAVLASRDAVSSDRDRLKYYFLSKGVSLTVAVQGSSNVFIGSEL